MKSDITNRFSRRALRPFLLASILLVAGGALPGPAYADGPPPPDGRGPIPPHAPGGNPNGFSLGVILGDPTGLTLRGGIGARNAIQAHFGFSPFPGSGLVAGVDWTFDAWDFLRENPTAGLLFYFGFGAKGEWFTGHYFVYRHDGRRSFADNRHFGIGLRSVVGLRAPFRKAPFDVFFELAPGGVMFVLPGPGIYYDFDLAVGFRYRF
jgi:hypothetical protein